MRQQIITAALLIFLTMIVVAGTIYLTPLKHLNLIEPTINDVPPEEFYAKFKENPDDYIFIDVRPVQVYAEQHAEGSINIPLHEFFDQRKIFPKSGKEIVLICSGGRASGVGYSYLEHFGFFNISRIEGGVEAWYEAKLPVVTK